MKRLSNRKIWIRAVELMPDEFKKYPYSYMVRNGVNINNLLGKTISEITISSEDEAQEQILFECTDGSAYLMYHEQDCCESVEIDDINGDLDCLIGTPLTLAEEVTQSDRDENPPEAKDSWDDSYTWTFYKLGTVKGYVDIRWYGTSNGYYSESVEFAKLR
jgi:hypothetical protein